MASGITEACALQPLDVAKTRLQLDAEGKYRGMLGAVRTIAKEEGGRALYKGLSPFVTHLTLKYALRFGSFAWFRQSMHAVLPEGSSEAGVNFTAGLAAGLTEAVLIVTPFEVVKTRLQKQRGLTNLKYTGPVNAAVTIVKQEGFAALWNGVAPTMLRQGSNQAFNFMSFMAINKFVWGKEDGDGVSQPVWQTASTGLLAAAVGPLFNCPLDVVKTRLMAQDRAGGAPKYSGMMDALRTIAKEEGLPALWKGLVPRLARLAPGQAITWTVVTNVTTWLEQREIASRNGA
jgi:solute carrier family 25 citrate transporter 1